MSQLGQKRTNHRGPKSTFVRCYSNSGQTRLRLECPLSAIADIAGFILSLRALRKHSGPRVLEREELEAQNWPPVRGCCSTFFIHRLHTSSPSPSQRRVEEG